MMLMRTILRRAIKGSIVMGAAVLCCGPSLFEARGQQPSSQEGLHQLMMHREEMSRRAVDETLQRRFEDKKSDTTFPSDRTKTSKGVVRALTPEEQKALKHNERGLEFFSKGKLDNAIKEYQEAIRSDPKL